MLDHRTEVILASLLVDFAGLKKWESIPRVSSSAENLTIRALLTIDSGLARMLKESPVSLLFECDLYGLKNSESLELWSCLAKVMYNFQFAGCNFESKENNQVIRDIPTSTLQKLLLG